MNCNDSIQIKTGTDLIIPFAITNNGTPKDITGYTFVMTVKKSIDLDDSEALFQVTDTKINAAIGTTKFVVSSAETASFTEGEYIGDVKMFDSSGNKTITNNFNVIVTKAVTQKQSV